MLRLFDKGSATALASTVDFRQFERHGMIFPSENKDVVLFPEPIGGQYVALHRPERGNSIYHAFDVGRPIGRPRSVGKA